MNWAPQNFRVARPTDQLAALEHFYVEGLGLQVRGRFAGHAGYDGLILDYGEAGVEIEFTSHVDGSPCPAPSEDNLLVFYLENADAVEDVRQRMAAIGVAPVVPENPYWQDISLTFADPDGWRVTLVDSQALAKNS